MNPSQLAWRLGAASTLAVAALAAAPGRRRAADEGDAADVQGPRDLPGKEGLMLTVEYLPGGSDPVHRHDAHAFVYVLEGAPS